MATILVVDDEVNLRITLSAILQTAGYSVTAVGHPRDALTALAAGPYDLVFLDIRMPDMDGTALLAEIRKLYADMPVLILTAYATVQSSIEAVRLGARDYLLKPVDPPLILARVKAILDEQKQSQRRREIVAQIQNLLAELQAIDGEAPDPVSLNALSAVLPSASARFLQRGAFTLDLHARHALLNDQLLNLPPSSFDYLVTLVRHAPNSVTYEELVQQSQGYEIGRREAQEMVRWRIFQLRQAIEADPSHPRYIVTERGIGYRLVP